MSKQRSPPPGRKKKGTHVAGYSLLLLAIFGILLSFASGMWKTGVVPEKQKGGGKGENMGEGDCMVRVVGEEGAEVGVVNMSGLDLGFRYYTSNGFRVKLDRVCKKKRIGTALPTLYRFQRGLGSNFVWPSGYVGKKVTVNKISRPKDSSKPIVLETLSLQPKVFLVHNFISQEEADELIFRATDPRNPYSLRRSTTGTEDWNRGGASDVSSTRTSENAFDISSQTSISIKKRAFQLLRMRYKQCASDGIQILRYDIKQAYIAHEDFFNLGVQGGHNFDPKTGGSNRFATVFLYLSDVEEGGQTVFPLATNTSLYRKENPPAELSRMFREGSWEHKMVKDCYAKFSVKPKKLSAVLFYNQDSHGNLDHLSLHGGCPVISGQKWAANVWVWNDCRYAA
ncbi:hypothetical protein AAMO2058_001183700 [Amorphochlora amoebiformis]